MNVRIFGVRAMECMYAQTRPRFMLSSERVWGKGVRTHVNSKGKIPSTGAFEENQTCATASCRTASPTHYQLSYSGPICREYKGSKRFSALLVFISVTDFQSVMVDADVVVCTSLTKCAHFCISVLCIYILHSLPFFANTYGFLD